MPTGAHSGTKNNNTHKNTQYRSGAWVRWWVRSVATPAALDALPLSAERQSGPALPTRPRCLEEERASLGVVTPVTKWKSARLGRASLRWYAGLVATDDSETHISHMQRLQAACHRHAATPLSTAARAQKHKQQNRMIHITIYENHVL